MILRSNSDKEGAPTKHNTGVIIISPSLITPRKVLFGLILLLSSWNYRSGVGTVDAATSFVINTSSNNVTSDTTTTTATTTNVDNNAAREDDLSPPPPAASSVFNLEQRVVVTDQAMGARCAVAADFDGDGKQDLVSASSNDNAVSWFRNEGIDNTTGLPIFSIKKKITWSSLGSRIVTVADIDGDGDVDVVGASYYDSTLRWFENDGTGEFTPHIISTAVNEGQGVTVADLDNDGDPDVVSASSGDNTIAVFKNIDKGQFCEIKEVVDDNAVGARTVVAADLNGDGWIDLASASKDDNTVAWYPNDGTGHFSEKHVVSAGNESLGAYSLVAVDIDKDGDQDLIVASNGNDQVSLWRNDGTGNFEKTLIFDNADFVLSVTAVDFDRDGDIDVASASFFDGYINWYENVDGEGYEWRNHTIYVGIQGHYVSTGDMDGDGDDDLIAVTHAENTVAVYLAQTECQVHHHTQDCCHTGTWWNGTDCEYCPHGTYGAGSGSNATCVDCPMDSCVIPGQNIIPFTCSGITRCADAETSIASCSCPEDSVKDPLTDACSVCPEGQVRPDTAGLERSTDSLGNYSLWELQQGSCYVEPVEDYTVPIVVISLVAIVFFTLIVLFAVRQNAQARADALWTINKDEIKYDDPINVLGRGSFGEVLKGYYRGTAVAIKRTIPESNLDDSDSEARDMRVSVGERDLGGSERIDFRGSMIATMSASNMSVLDTFDGGGATPVVLSGRQRHRSFVREMRILSQLRHPCITTVMGAVLDKEPLLIMEFMENGSLRDLLSNKTFPLDPEQTLPLIRDILQGIRFLHAADPPIIHGDLKTANVLVDGNFRAKIADFGLATKKAGVGTPYVMAPELLRGEEISTHSDVYAFGVLLWEVMTHKIPYEDLEMSNKEILEMVREGSLRPDCHEGLDQELVECMEECWSQEPEKRPTLEDLDMKLIPLCGQNLFSVMQERNQHASKQSNLLQDVFPEHIAKDLLAGKKVEAEHHDCVSIYFSDIVGFTTISSTLTAQEVSDLLDRLYIQFDELAGKHDVFKLETIGDAWVGVTNLNDAHSDDHAARIARFSIDAMSAAQQTIIHPGKPEMGHVKIRVGFHSGPVVSNVVGTRNPRYCLFGDTMNTASRMESTSKELRIQCSHLAARLAKKQDRTLKFTPRGKIKVKGKGHQKTFWLNNLVGIAEEDYMLADDSQVVGSTNRRVSMTDFSSQPLNRSLVFSSDSQPFNNSSQMSLGLDLSNQPINEEVGEDVDSDEKPAGDGVETPEQAPPDHGRFPFEKAMSNLKHHLQDKLQKGLHFVEDLHITNDKHKSPDTPTAKGNAAYPGAVPASYDIEV